MDDPPKINFIGRISHLFTVNQSLSILLLVAVVLFGIMSFFLTPKQYNPEIVRPAYLVSLQYEGATIEQSRNRVVYELVEKINAVPGVDDVFTTIADGGHIETTVIFAVGYDATQAKLDLRSQIEQHDYLAKGFITTPQIIEINPETIPVLQIVFAADMLTPAQLREEVTKLTHTLRAVPDVSSVSVHGGYLSQLVVELEPEKLMAAEVSVEMVSATLAAAQVRAVHDGVAANQYKIESVFVGGASTIEELGALLVTEDIRVRDVARVYEGVAGERSSVWYSDGEQLGEAVVLAVSKVEGSSAPVVTSAVLDTLNNELQTDAFKQLSYQVASDDGATAAKEIYGLTKNLLSSIAIVAVVLMLFLSIRAALVVLVAIPVTFLIVFGLGWLFGETINRITLFALILSLGLLVDSAIVVVENIYAHLERWKAGNRSVAKAKVIAQAVHEVGMGLFLSTITSVIVFLPMAYITGMMGPYMGPIAFFVPAALIVSLVVAIVITPFVASKIITGKEWRWAVGDWFAARLASLTRFYGQLLHTLLSSRTKQRWLLRSALGLFLVSLVLPLTGLVHFQMLPKADRDQVYLYIDLPVDSNVAYTKEVSEAVGKVVNQDADVKNIQSYIGEPPIIDFNGMFKGAQGRDGAYQATVRINLTASDERSRSSSEITDDLRQQFQQQIPAIVPHVRLMEEPPGPPVRATFVAKVQASNQAVQEQAAAALFSALADVQGITDTYLGTDEPTARTVYTFDNEVAHELGVSQPAVEQALRLLSQPVAVAEYRLSEQLEQTEVVLSLPAAYRDSPLDISNVMVSTQSGGVVPLAAVLQVKTAQRPSTQQLEGVTPITYVTAEVSERSIVYAMIDVMRLLAKGEVPDLEMTDWSLFDMTLLHAPSGSEVLVDWGGEWEMTLENFRDLGVALGVALLLVYGVLVAQYNRFSTPAYILVTVPLGLVGILWGFFLLDSVANIYLTATALIGFIALIGLVVNNAIIFLEYVEQEKRLGHDFKNSLLNAGQARLRPILLTSLTTVLGSLTIAGDPVWSGLAWAIVFGLSLSTILTLVIYPTLLMYYTSKDYE
jgi:multidrug efflux pump subunit AcrB